MRNGIVPILEAGGVDLVMCGHSHAYERSWFMNGHFGGSTNFNSALAKSRGDGRIDGDGPYRKRSVQPSPRSGTVYLVAGRSGPTSGVTALHPPQPQAGNTPR